jgi:hypothetical protein
MRDAGRDRVGGGASPSILALYKKIPHKKVLASLYSQSSRCLHSPLEHGTASTA